MQAKEIFKNKYIQIIVLVAIAILIYSIAWRYEMYGCLDDGKYVLHNKNLGFSFQNIKLWLTQPCIGLFVPVTMFSFMFDYNLWGLDTLGYHLQNTFWFIVTIIAIYACLIKFKLKPWHAFVLTLIYTVHPQRVESVVWITERKDVLYGAFFFIALFFFLDRFEKDKFNFLTFFFYILALFSKPMAITLPAVLVMIEFFRKRQFAPMYYIKKIWPYALLVVAYLILISNLRTDFIKPPIDMKRMFSLVLFNIYWYTKNTFVPSFYSSMNVLYPKIVFSWQVIIQMLIFYIVLVGAGIVAYVKIKKETLLYSILPLLVCYIAVLSPVLGGFQFSFSDFADRYNYMPSVFMLFAAGCIVPLLINQQTHRVITLFIVVYIMILTYSTISYIPAWENSNSVFSKSCEQQPANIYSVLTLGLLETKAGKYQNAIFLSERLKNDYLNDAKKRPLMAQAGYLYIKARIFFKNGQKKRAAKILFYLNKDKHLQKSICDLGEGKIFYMMLADCYLGCRMVDKAILCFEKITKLKNVPEHNILFYKGMIAFFQKDKQKALGYFEKAHQLAPDDKNIEYNLKRVKDSLKKQSTKK